MFHTPALLRRCIVPALCLVAVSCDDESSLPEEEVTDRLYYVSGNLWPQRQIPVCWENQGFATEKAAVREVMTGPRSWSAHARIDFTGWGDCRADSRGIRITAGRTMVVRGGLGRQSDGTSRMELDFTASPQRSWSQCTMNGLGRIPCIQAVAIHEFGHALGFAHEQNREDTPDTCLDAPQGSDGDRTYGAWDGASIMNYCADTIDLSPTDIAGVKALYGRRTAGSPVTALARYADGSGLDAWLTDGDGRVRTAFYNDRGVPWNGWHTLAGAVTGRLVDGAPIAALSRYPNGGGLDVWVAGSDDWIYTAFYNDAGVPWNGWHRVANPVPSGVLPGASITALSRYANGSGIDLWVTGDDGNVYTAFYNDAGVPWNGWHRVAGAVPSGLPAGAPIAALSRFADGSGLDIFVTGNDGNVYTAFYNDYGVPWNGWYAIGGAVPSGLNPGTPITAIARAADGSVIDLWVTGRDGNVYATYYNHEGWHGWFRVAGAVPSGVPAGAPVAAVSRAPDGTMLDVFVTANDGQVYAAYYSDHGIPWTGWIRVAGAVPSGLPGGAAVTAVSRFADGSGLDLWVRANDGNVYGAYYNDNGLPWTGWFRVANPVPGE